MPALPDANRHDCGAHSTRLLASNLHPSSQLPFGRSERRSPDPGVGKDTHGPLPLPGGPLGALSGVQDATIGCTGALPRASSRAWSDEMQGTPHSVDDVPPKRDKSRPPGPTRTPSWRAPALLVRDGKIIRWQPFETHAAALEAVGLRE